MGKRIWRSGVSGKCGFDRVTQNVLYAASFKNIFWTGVLLTSVVSFEAGGFFGLQLIIEWMNWIQSESLSVSISRFDVDEDVLLVNDLQGRFKWFDAPAGDMSGAAAVCILALSQTRSLSLTKTSVGVMMMKQARPGAARPGPASVMQREIWAVNHRLCCSVG